MRTIWNGSISFGLVNIPVGLALATTPKAKQSDVSFRTLHRECKTPIRQKRWCPTHEREVGPDEIVKGWEVAKGEFVIVEDADLEAIQQHDDSRSIDITRFVPLDQVDPVYLDRTYYLAPAQAPAQRRPYVLLLEAMKDSEMGAIGRFVLRGAEYFALIRPKGEALVLETLFLAEDVRSQAEIEEAVAGTEVKKAELDLAQQVMQSLVGEFDPSELVSQYRSDLRQMLEAMKDSEMGAIGRFVLRGAEYFALIRPKGEALVLETLFLAEDVRSQAEIEEAVAGTEVKKAELDLAQQVMQSLVGEFDPSELVSQYRSDLRQMLEAKLDGKEIAKPEPVPEAPVVDLLEALKKSVAEAKERKTPSGDSSKTKAASKSGSRTRRAPARKSA